MNWQPIETAPKEFDYRNGGSVYGPRILVACSGYVKIARWWQHDSGANNFLGEDEWACFPSHWMPLPEPPQS